MEELFKSLASNGVAAAVLAYILWKIDPRLKKIEEAIVRQSKIDLLRIASSPTTAPQLKQVAQDMMKEIEESQNERT